MDTNATTVALVGVPTARTLHSDHWADHIVPPSETAIHQRMDQLTEYYGQNR